MAMNIVDTVVGKNMKAHPDVLGLYISLHEMYIAQSVRQPGGGVRLESLLRVPIPAVDPSKLKPLELNDGFFSETNWLDALTKVAAKKKWNNKKVVVSLSASFSLLRHFVIPTVIERKHWKEAIPLQARKYVHFPFEKATYAYHVYEFETAASKQKRLGVIFAITPKTIVERLEKGLKSVGLDPVAIEPVPISLSRSFVDNDKEAVDAAGRIYSFFGEELASFIFVNQDAPVLLREVEIAGALPVERRRFEITNYTEFISKQLERDPFVEAVIMGVDVDNWKPLLEADSKKPVRQWNFREVYGIEAKSEGEIAAIGASTKFHNDKGPDLDFIKRNRLSDYEFNAVIMAWKITGVILLFFLFLLGKAFWKVRADQHQLKKAARQSTTNIADFKGLSAQQIQSNLSKIKSQNSNLEKLLSTTYLTPLLVDVADSIPNAVWISKMSYKEDFPAKKGSPVRSLFIEGSIQSGNSDKDLTLGNQFRDQLVKAASIKELCGNRAEIKFKDLALTGEAVQPTTSSRTSTPVRKGTSYTLTCTNEQGGKR